MGAWCQTGKELQTGTQLSYLVTQRPPRQDFFPPGNHLWSPFPEGWVALAMALCPLVALAGIAASSPSGQVLRIPRLIRAESQAHTPGLEALELGVEQDSPRCRPAHTCCSSRP